MMWGLISCIHRRPAMGYKMEKRDTVPCHCQHASNMVRSLRHARECRCHRETETHTWRGRCGWSDVAGRVGRRKVGFLHRVDAALAAGARAAGRRRILILLWCEVRSRCGLVLCLLATLAARVGVDPEMPGQFVRPREALLAAGVRAGVRLLAWECGQRTGGGACVRCISRVSCLTRGAARNGELNSPVWIRACLVWLWKRRGRVGGCVMRCDVIG